MREANEAASTDPLAAIADDPRYRELVERRSRLAWVLTAIMLVVFFGYILLIAFDRAFLARPILSGTMSLGIPVGIAVILVGIGLTGVYVHRANTEFDPLVRALRDEAGR